jgi:hypothetical protein
VRLPANWGATAAELAARYPCDEDATAAHEAWFRAVTVRAPAAVVFRWLCQLKVAPYSYDSVDNLGRRSPRTLTPGAETLVEGEPVMTIFRLRSFAPGEHLTLRLRPRSARLFGDIVLSYVVRDDGAGGSRLVAKLLVARPPGPLGGLRRRGLAWGDAAMMRRQLLNLRALAEGSAQIQPRRAA